MNIAFEYLKPNSTILTPNRRLAATLLKKYHQYKIDQGEHSWKSLDILPYISWIERLWQTLTLHPIENLPFLLSNGEEEVLWEEILRQHANHMLLQISETASLAKAAFDLLKQWKINLDHPKLSMTEDSLTFLNWANAFEKNCKENFLIPGSTISQILIQQIDKLDLPKELIIIGFTEFTPEQKYFFDTCDNRGTKITFVENFVRKTPTSTEKRICLTDTEKEIEVMARFAKIKLKENVSIGCIVPRLEVLRDRVMQIFTDIFKGKNHLFNISVGKNLFQYPVIQTAIKLLNLISDTISLENFSYILRSPFLGDAEYEYHARAKFYYRLREENATSKILKKILDPHEKLCLGVFCPRLYKRLDTFKTYIKTIQKNHTPDEWGEIFISLLKILGWPGERSLNSYEYLVVQRFLNLLNEFRQWNRVLPSQTYQTALHYFTRFTSNTIFQPESQDAPIQILGMVEAADIPFDYVWIMGLDDTAWPPSAKPNPFIPKVLQRKLHMPHANAECELKYSLRLLQQIKRSTHHIIVSHPLKNDTTERRPSALIEDIEEISLETLSLSEHIPHQSLIFQHKKCESFQDEKAISLQENEKISGGVNIIKQQAACPFKAFAEIRLHARSNASPTLGLRPKDRGIILHKTLELLWKQIENSEKLNELQENELKNIVDDSIKKAIFDIRSENISEIRYLSLERARLQQILWEWLQFEKNRPPFKVVAHEKKHHLQIGPLQLDLRVDRIDELSDGSLFLIDYKTSKNNDIKYWFSDRLDEPQLPLYCLTNPLDITSIAFAEIHACDTHLIGISKSSLNIPRMKLLEEIKHTNHQNWEAQIAAWQNNLEKISYDFYQGVAAVDPKHPVLTCQYCHLKPLCRINNPVITCESEE